MKPNYFKELSKKFGICKVGDTFGIIIDSQNVSKLEEFTLIKRFHEEVVCFYRNEKYVKKIYFTDITSQKQKIDKNEHVFISFSVEVYGRDLFIDFSHYIEFKNNLLNIKDNAFFLNCNLTIFEVVEDQDNVDFHLIHNYIKIVKIINQLKSLSINNENSELKDFLLFSDDLKCSLKLTYNPVFLQKVYCEDSDLETFESLLNVDEEKKIIIRSFVTKLLLKYTALEDQSNRLSKFIINFGKIVKELKIDYRLYILDFSFDKVRNELEEKRNEYFQKINEIMNNLILKLLGVPAVFLLGVTKLEKHDENILIIFQNFGILIVISGSFYLYHVMVRNNKIVIEDIKREYINIKRKLSAIDPDIEKETELENSKLLLKIRGINKQISYSWFFTLIILIYTFLAFLSTFINYNKNINFSMNLLNNLLGLISLLA